MLIQMSLTAGWCGQAVSRFRDTRASIGKPRNTWLWTHHRKLGLSVPYILFLIGNISLSALKAALIRPTNQPTYSL